MFEISKNPSSRFDTSLGSRPDITNDSAHGVSPFLVSSSRRGDSGCENVRNGDHDPRVFATSMNLAGA